MKTLIYVVVLLISLIPTKANMLLKQYEPEKPKEEIPDFIRVKATMYTVSGTQTDSTPLITASGFKLHPSNPKKHRIIAVSRDLKRKFKFGEKVRIEGVGKYSGVYTVRDVMNARWTKKIDILINPEDKAISYNKARLYRL